MHLIPTILSGGAGSRLWPVSRELFPKPFIRLYDGQSLLQKAFVRASSLVGITEILTVTNRELLFITEDEYKQVNPQKIPTAFILEPMGRNTAPAITIAMLQIIKQHGEDAIMLVLTADHLITKRQAFQQAVSQATALANSGKLVTFGIQPDRPETGYGYLEVINNTVLRFEEKPSRAKAEEYVQSQRYLWNSGMICVAVGCLLEQMTIICPELVSAAQLCLQKSTIAVGQDFSQVELEKDSFSKIRQDSFDCAVMEKSTEIAVVPCDLGWRDIGSWETLSQFIAPDAQGNRVDGKALLHATSNCYIKSPNRIIGAVGIDNLIIVDTDDALLIADQTKTQDVKHIYAKLKSENHQVYKLHQTVTRPWGTYTVLGEGKNFKIKRIEVKAGASLSLQVHMYRSEHWVIVSGIATVTNGELIMTIKTNESTYIPAGHKHRLENKTNDPVIIIEVQSGEYLGEDDIMRFDDVYGRASIDLAV